MTCSIESLRKYYDDLVSGDPHYYCVVGSDLNWKRNHGKTHVYAGSFNPLHDMHRLIYDSMAEHIKRSPSHSYCYGYEISLCRDGKEFLSFDDLVERLSQFDDSKDVVYITAAKTFVEKAGVFRWRYQDRIDTVFHIGYDTAIRLRDQDGYFGIQGIAADFVIYPRDGLGIHDVFGNKIPDNCFEGLYCRPYVSGVSSTKLRSSNSAGCFALACGEVSGDFSGAFKE